MKAPRPLWLVGPRWASVGLAAVAVCCFAVRAPAPSIEFNMINVPNGFNFNTHGEAPVGFVTSMSVGNVILTPDFSVTLATNPAQTTNVVAVLSSENWAGGEGDPLSFDGQISTSNKTALRTLLASGIASGTPVEFNFLIFNFDPEASVWYQAFAPADNAPLGGVIEFSNKASLTVATNPSTGVTNPTNYAFTLGIEPGSYSYDLDFASSSTSSAEMQWGTMGGSASGPTVQTVAGPGLNGATATLTGSASSSFAAQAFFQYGTIPALTSYTTSPLIPVDYGSSGASVSFPAPGLNFATTYYYRAVASNVFGTSVGSILSFNTLSTNFIITNSSGAGNGYPFGFTNASNASFSVRASSSLSSPGSAWPSVGSATQIGAGQYYFSGGSMTNGAQFYRVSSP